MCTDLLNHAATSAAGGVAACRAAAQVGQRRRQGQPRAEASVGALFGTWKRTAAAGRRPAAAAGLGAGAAGTS